MTTTTSSILPPPNPTTAATTSAATPRSQHCHHFTTPSIYQPTSTPPPHHENHHLHHDKGAPQVVSAAKLPILNPNEFKLWKMRIEQYFLMTDYSLWEVILNGDSPVPTRVIEGVVQPVAPTTAEQRLARKNELKTREKRFGGNKETKKVQKTLLKQQYKNFTGSSSESLDQIHDRLQKLISQIEILGHSLSQEDINLKFLRSLPTEWRTHTLIWRNKTDLEEQSLDDLFNSLKIYEAEVKSSSSGSTFTQNITFVSSQTTDSTNEPVSVIASVSATSATIPVFVLHNVDTLSNAVIYYFFISQSNSPQLDNDDLKQIIVDDLEEMDLKWKMAMSPKDTRRNVAAEPQRRIVSVETSTSNALVSQSDEEEPTNYALMAFTSSSSSSSDNELRDNALVFLRQNFKKAKQERDDLKLKLEKFQTSSKNLSQLLASQTNDKTRLGYNTQVFTSSMFDCDEMFTSETDNSLPAKLGPTKPGKDLSYTYKPSAPIIEDWVSDSKDDSEAEILQNALSFVQPTKQVKTPRPSVKTLETSIPATTHTTTIPKLKIHGNSRNRKACFVCKSLNHVIKNCDFYENKMAQTPARNHAQRGNHQQYARMTLLNPQKHVVPTSVLTKSKLVPITTARPVTAVVPKTHVTRQRPAKTIVTKPHSPPRRHINRSLSPKANNFPPKVTTVKVPQVNVVKGVLGKWEWKPKCLILDNVSIHSSASMTLKRFDYNNALRRSKNNGGYVAFGGNPKGGKISGKGKIRTGKFDFDDVYFVKELKFNLFSVSQISDNGTEFKNNDLKQFCGMKGIKKEFSVPRTPQQNEIAERKNRTLIEAAKTMLVDSLLSISFWAEAVNTACFMRPFGCPVTILDTLDPLGKFDGKADEGFLVGYSVSKNNLMQKKQGDNVQQYVLFPVWSSSSKNPQNTDDDVAFEVKEPEFEGKKPESEVHVSPSSSSQTKKHDDKTK
nr:hypothetical protein [Tanacetum cinerariifolium]